MRGLTIEGIGSGHGAIIFNTGGNLEIENCVVRNFSFGIEILPSTSSRFSVSNTIVSGNFFTKEGITIAPRGSAVVAGVLSKVTVHGNDETGIFVDGSSTTWASLKVTIVDSEVSSNDEGVLAFSESGHPTAAVMLRNVVASNNGEGLNADQNVIFWIAHSVVTGNDTGVAKEGPGTIFSYGDNDIDGNTNDNTGVLTPLAMH